MTAEQPPIPFDVQAAFGLSPEQAQAAALRGRDVMVTAGAGSGKTRTLVARYLSLLAERLAPQHITAITFTEKAAREMRNRCRVQIYDQIRASQGDARAFWREQQLRLDAARIGTIHSLCAEILRSHPAEVGIDPEFEVLDEGAAAALRNQVIESVLASTLEDPQLAALYRLFTVGALRRLMEFALQQRLDLAAWLAAGESLLPDPLAAAGQALLDFMQSPPAAGLVADLRRLQAGGELADLGGDTLADQLYGLLVDWASAEEALASGRMLDGLLRFTAHRKANMDLRAGKRGSAPREMLRELREIYDQGPGQWLPDEIDETLERAYQFAQPQLQRLFQHTLEAYTAALRERRALDFDDLESLALQLLEDHDHVRQRWQKEIQSLLVDEFQDTNQRQRRLIQALAGEQPGRLFFVGDDRQSIYRFRGADVTVFREVLRQVQARQGAVINLRTTYRAHAPLLQAAARLLEPAMQPPLPPPDYWVAFSPLEPFHDQPGLPGPVLEFVVGEDRPSAAANLAAHLLALREAGELQHWDQVALLFRASTHFNIYESALETAGIPFVTVAGRGFYDRPEIRAVLNLLRALANPWDDLAMAGLLRSPAFGLSDGALYRLRWPHGSDREPAHLYAALHSQRDRLTEPDRSTADRALEQLQQLIPLTDQLPVAALLEKLVALTDLRAVYAHAGLRLVQNLDKLIEAAFASRLVSVRAFLEYIDTLRDVGARESEAPVEAAGALQLLTIHKAKGLEFDVVVLADAGASPNTSKSPAYLLEDGFAARPDQFNADPLAYRYLAQLDRHQESAEEARLIYVALTRARQKLLINGHASSRVKNTWLGRLAAAAGLDRDLLDPAAAGSRELASGATLRLTNGTLMLAAHPDPEDPPGMASDRHLPPGGSLQEPYRLPEPVRAEVRPRREPGRAIGDMVHLALQRWSFPQAGQPSLELQRLLETAARKHGLLDAHQRQAAIAAAVNLLTRFQSHPLWQEIDHAPERYHELPYTRQAAAGDSGQIDLLYRSPEGWKLLEFKSEPLPDSRSQQRAVNLHREQVLRYQHALGELFPETVQSSLVLLDAAGQVQVIAIG